MSTITSLRRAGAAVVAAALAVSVSTAGSTAYATPTPHVVAVQPAASRSADWLADQLHHGLIHNFQFGFDDYGLTADTALALTTLNLHTQKRDAAVAALEQHVTDYTGAKQERFAGALGKLLVLVQDAGQDPTTFGGVDLVTRTANRVSTTAPIVGRIEDKSAFGDFANVLGQIFVTRGLLEAHDPAGQSALDFLLAQQCRAAGYFRLNFTTSKTSPNQRCHSKTSPSDLDVTALAVIELKDLAAPDSPLASALDSATNWLVEQQKKDGGFRGGTTTSPKNTNSTGLAGSALLAENRCAKAQAAAQWVRERQVSNPPKSSPLAGETGAIAYNSAALNAGRKHGIDKTTRDQWRRASAQAAPSLLALTCPA